MNALHHKQVHYMHVIPIRGGDAAPTYAIFLVHIHLFHHHTLNHGQAPDFLPTHGILVGVTCGSSMLVSSFMNQAWTLHNETSCSSSLIVCAHSHDHLELGEFLALEPAMLSHSYSLAKPLSSRCVAC